MRMTLYMLSDNTSLDGSALRDGSGYTQVPTATLDGMPVALFVRATPATAVKWVSQLQSILAPGASLPNLRAQTSAAVLLVDYQGTKYAITFGNGFQALSPSKIVSGFGLRVAANSIAQQKVKSADTKMLSSAGRSQKTVLPEASELTALGIEPLEEWVRQLSGKVADAGFASSATGADSLRLSIKNFALAGLKTKLKQIEALHKATTYKATFGFIDNFEQLNPRIDGDRIATLNTQVLTLLRSSDPSVYFAAPDPFDIPDVINYVVVRSKKVLVSDLVQDEMFQALSKLKMNDDEALEKVHIRALDGEGNPLSRTYSLHECLQVELPDGPDLYVLSSGRWFKVRKDYVEQVNAALADLDDLTTQLSLPAWAKQSDGKFEPEGKYNERTATERGFVVLDKSNLNFGGHARIEVCDLLTPEKQLICVKKATRSSTLSHLFAQGSVSAGLMYHPSYKAKLIDGLQEAGASSTDFGTLDDWTVIYAVGTEKAGPVLDGMFFFSRMNLVQHLRDIRSRGIRVAIAKIQMT